MIHFCDFINFFLDDDVPEIIKYAFIIKICKGGRV